ncbi:hypothetical protein KY336_03290, partial [Candidatus Woesearchaeota archaeon]|nr:hypothetical protein [Candidatus Woesearchaeota archaeon]
LKEDLGDDEIGDTGTGLQIDFALDTVISYREGTVSMNEHVYLKHAVGVETPFDYTKFLTPEMINQTLEILDDWIEFLEQAVDVAEKVALATTVGCVAMTVYSWLSGGATPENEKRLYMVCDRVWCPTIPPDCKQVNKVASYKGKDYVYDEDKKEYFAADDKKKENPLAVQPKPEDVSFKQDVNGMTTSYRWVPGTQAKTIDGRPICARGENAIEIRSVNESAAPITFKSTGTTYSSGSRGPMVSGAGTVRYACTTLNQSAYSQASAKSGSVGCYSEGPPGFHETKCWPGDADSLNDDGEVNPYDDIFLSLQCGCVSGVQGHLSNFLRVSQGMKKCLQQAMIGEVRGGYCERLFAQYVCDLITWAIKKLLMGKSSTGSFGSGEGSTFRGNFQEVNKRLQNRYGALIQNRFGLSTDQLVHKACIGAITSDWSDLRDVFQQASRVPVAPVIGPMIPESRFNAWNTFTGEASINYYLTLGILSGGQRVTGSVKIVCDKREPGGEYCPPGAPVIIYEEGIFVEEDGSIETNIFYTDEKARYWGNVAILDLAYQLGDQAKKVQKKEQIIRKSPMIAQCHFQLVPPGILCETISGALQAVEYKSSSFSPNINTYYPGNSVVVKSEVASASPAMTGADTEQPDVYLVYEMTNPRGDVVTNKDDSKKLASWKIDLSGSKTVYVNNIHTFEEAIGVSSVEEQLVFEAEKVRLSSLGIDKSVYLEKGDVMNVRAESVTSTTKYQRKMLLFKLEDKNATCAQSGDRIECTANEDLVVDRISYSIDAVSSDDRAKMIIEAGPDVLETRTLPAPRTSRISTASSTTSTAFPPGTYKINITLYHDVDKNGIIDNRDQLVPFGRDSVQSKQLTFSFKDVPPKDCKTNPKVEFVLPLKNSLITNDVKTFYTKNGEVIFTMWDDCNQIESAALYDEKSWQSAQDVAREWNAKPENKDNQKKEPYDGFYINKLDGQKDSVTGAYTIMGPNQLKYSYKSSDAFDLVLRVLDKQGKIGESKVTVIMSGDTGLVLGTPAELECQRNGGVCKAACDEDEEDLGPCDTKRCCK